MAEVVELTDPADPRLADYTRLRDVNLRRSLEAEHGLFLAEGEKVIRRAVAAGHPVRSFLLSERWLPGLADVLGGCAAPAYVLPPEAIERVTGFPVHRGALASLRRLPLPSAGEVLAGRAPGRSGTAGAAGSAGAAPRRVVVLEDLVDHGNVGAIFRCAAALGIDAVLLSPGCADPLYRRSIKVSMGAVFAVPYARLAGRRAGLAELRAAGFAILALTPDQSAVPLDAVDLGPRVALLLGSEGDGLSSGWLRDADTAVCIPMAPGAMDRGVDSLNVVAAAAIACHSLVRDGCPAGE